MTVSQGDIGFRGLPGPPGPPGEGLQGPAVCHQTQTHVNDVVFKPLSISFSAA